MATNVTSLATTPALVQFEIATLTEFNRFLKEEQDDNFNTFDELKDIHDNSGSTRQYLTGILEHVIRNFIRTLDKHNINLLVSELGLEILSDQKMLCDVEYALLHKYIYSPSPRQLKMMQLCI